ncbi:MAG: hypothetical protein P4M14_01735 [Gammaproteobacteria bacterium]|nr:hypothetical protein [Gammaproteobacteria bacterium]
MKNALSSVLAFFSSVSLGLLSFIGMMILSGSWPWAIVAFFLASVIEGEIFDQNIKQAIKNLAAGPIAELEQIIVRRELENSSKRYRECSAMLKATHCPVTKKLMKEKMQELENAYTQKILRAGANANAYLLAKQSAIKREVRRKAVGFVFCGILAVGAGVSSGLATLSAAYTGLMTLGIVAGTAMGIAIPIAIISSVGYALMMYINVADMIQNDTLQQWAKNTREFLVRREQESIAWFITRGFFAALGAATVVGLAVFATIATAGTWWIAAKRGALLMTGITEAIAKVVRTVTVICMAIPNIIFNTVNALKSVGQIAEYTFRNLGLKLERHFFQPLENKSTLQCCNPFYWIAKSVELIIHAAVFSGHLISVGLTSDGLSGVPPLVTTGAGTLTELLTDWHYIFEVHDNKEHGHDHHHDHDHGDEEHGHHHHHSNLPTKFAMLLLLPLIVLARAWDWLFSGGQAHAYAHPPQHHDHEHEHNHEHDHEHDHAQKYNHEHGHEHHEHAEHKNEPPHQNKVAHEQMPSPVSRSSTASVMPQLHGHDHHDHDHHPEAGHKAAASHDEHSPALSSWSPRLHAQPVAPISAAEQKASDNHTIEIKIEPPR